MTHGGARSPTRSSGWGDILGIQAVIYDAGRAGTEKQRRAPCLETLVEDAAKHDQAKIVFDLDDSLRS